MADLFSLLSNSGQGLMAHRSAAATAQHNLANVNTEGYARQRVTLAAEDPSLFAGGAFIGQGVTLFGVTQARDRFLEAQLPRALAGAAHSSAEAHALSSVRAFDLSAPGGLQDALPAFYGAMRTLSLTPGDPSARRAFVGAAEDLSRAFQQSAADVDAARDAVDAELGPRLDRATVLAGDVARLNREVGIAAASGAPPNDLLDARQRAVDELVALTGATVLVDDDGAVNVSLPGGGSLVTGDRAARLSAIPDAANGGHLAVQIEPTDGSTPRVLAAGEVGGTVGGLLASRDGALLDAEVALDQLAFDLAGALNAVHQTGFALDGSTGNALFDAGAAAAGAASRIRVDPAIVADPGRLSLAASAAGLPGDGTVLLDLLSTEGQAVTGGQTAEAALLSLTTQLGSATMRAESLAAQDESTLSRLLDMRAATSGVSIDEEMIELTKAQRAFEALTKVIQTADQMLDDLLRLKS